MQVIFSFLFYLADFFRVKHIQDARYISFFVQTYFVFFHTKHWNHRMHTLCFGLMMLSHVLSAFCSCETVHDVDIQGFVTLPLRFNDNNIERKKKKTPSVEQYCLHPGVSAKFVFTPFTPVFVMYHSQTPSPEMDQVGPAESESKVWPKHEVPKAHGDSEWTRGKSRANLKAEDSIAFHSMFLHC